MITAFALNRGRKMAAAVAIGLLLGVAVGVPYLGWLIALGVVAGYGWLLLSCTRWHAALGVSLVVSLVRFLVVLSWFWSTYPIDWLPWQASWLQLPVIAGYWASASLWLALGNTVAGVALWGVLKRGWWWLTPPLWLSGELLGSFLFSLFTWGPGATIGIDFSFGWVGYALATHGVLQWVSLGGGVFALGLVLVLLATFFLRTGSVTSRWSALVFGVLLASSIPTATVPTTTEGDTTIAIIETNVRAGIVSPEEARVRTAAVLEAYQAATARTPAYLLFPESLGFFDHAEPYDAQLRRLAFVATATEAIIIESGPTASPGLPAPVLRAGVFGGVLDEAVQADKQYLVPQGEFMPALYALVLDWLGFGPAMRSLQETAQYYPGPKTLSSEVDVRVPSILFCFESVSPLGVRRMVRTDGPSFMVHPISHASFHEPRFLWQQLDRMLQVQAQWNQVTIVSVANEAPSKTYYPNGSVALPPVVASGSLWRVRLMSL